MRSYIPTSLIESHKSYWATHFCSALECVHHHSIEQSPQKLPQFPNWTLSDLRGNLPTNFFYHLKRFIYNFGFQYFATHYLNQRLGNTIVDALIGKLQEHFDVKFNVKLNNYWFFVSGWDSKLSGNLNGQFDEIFPRKSGMQPPVIYEVIKNSDICLVLYNSEEKCNVGIFGEIEGNKGYKLSTNNFWINKSDYCVFAIGVVKGKNKESYIETHYCNGAPKINILFEAEHHVVSDFHLVVDCLELLLLQGPSSKQNPRDEEFGFFVNHLKINWNKPVIEILSFFHSMIDYNEFVGKVDGSLPFMASIQAKGNG